MIDELVAAAKSWRGLARLVVLVVTMESAAPQELVVKLGDSRRRWKRVAAAIAPMVDDIIGARGYDEAGELVGSWDAPDDDDDDGAAPDEPTEPAEHAAHRLHTQWTIREVAKVYEGAMRLNLELCAATIDIVRALRGSVTTPVTPVSEDEASKTLGLLLSSVMANNSTRSNNDEAQRDEGSPGGSHPGQGRETEHPETGT